MSDHDAVPVSAEELARLRESHAELLAALKRLYNATFVLCKRTCSTAPAIRQGALRAVAGGRDAIDSALKVTS